MSTPISFWLNHHLVQTDSPPGALLLDLIRGERHLTGTKEACREGDCGACLVLLGRLRAGHVGYLPVNSCLLPLGAAAGSQVVTIEGINTETLNPIQQALVDNGAIQCGYCTPGIVMALTAFFINSASSDYAAALDAAAGNLCRCTGYAGIKRAIAELCATYDLEQSPPERRLQDLVQWRILPEYFLAVPKRLADLAVSGPGIVNPDAVLVAGGTDLFVQRPAELLTQTLCFLDEPGQGQAIRREGGQCLIDAAATIETLRTSELLQGLFLTLQDDLKLVCSATIRQRATLGGNLVNASPIGDLAVLFLALDAHLEIMSDSGQRSVQLRQFFQGYKRIDLQPRERLSEIAFACPEDMLCSFEKVAKRTYLDIASVNSALSLTHSNGVLTCAHLAAGGIAPVPLYLKAASEYLRGQPINVATVRTAAEIALGEIAPISDSRGSVEYKRLLLRQLIYAHFLKLFPQGIRWEDLHATD